MSDYKARQYKNKFTLDGRLHPQVGVTPTKVKEVANLFRKAQAGNLIADATLREAVVSTDASVNLAHAFTMEFIPQYDEAIHQYGDWAGTRIVPDFRPVVLYSIFWGPGTGDGEPGRASDLTGAGLDANGVPRVIPEGSPYPMVSLSGGIESFHQKLKKRGLRFDWTWEARVNDVVGFFEQIPPELRAVSIDGKVAEFFDALKSVTSSVEVAGGRAPNGDTIPAKAVLSPEAVIQAIYERAQRTTNGRKIGNATGYNLFVPIGTQRFWDFQMSLNITQFVDGSRYYSGGPFNLSGLGNVTLVETEYVTGTNWYLAPKPGSTRRPVLEFLKLRGYETPELRVQNLSGSYVGGGAVSPFEGSFETDSLAYRLRNIDGAVLWDEKQVVWSDGSGGAITEATSV